jgi:curved DNA-binding protein CbpA
VRFLIEDGATLVSSKIGANTDMHRRSILRSVACDLKKLPIGALEAFVLSQVHGQSTAEDVAEAVGLELNDLIRVARRLADLGALSVDGEKTKTRRPGPPSTRRTSAPPSPPKAAKPLVPGDLVPVPRKHADLRSLGIGPREGFVLSQIDGVTSTADLSEITSLSARDLSDALHALDAAGAVDLGPAGQRSSKAPQPAAPVEREKPHSSHHRSATPHGRSSAAPHGRSSTAPHGRPSRAMRAAARAVPEAPPSQRPRASRKPPASEKLEPPPKSGPAGEETCDLPEAERARITETGARLEALDLYATLGVERDADGKVIRRAYHGLAAQFHPDRFFGKKLGAFRRPLERIFMRLTLAYDTLSNRARRTEYDATLPPPPERRTPTKRPTRKSLSAMRRASSHRMQAAAVAPVPVSAHAPAPAPGRAPAPVSAPRIAPVPMPMPVSAREPASAPSSPSSPDPLKRMYADKQRRNVKEHVDVFVRAAKEALERDDVVSAANHYRLALQCSDDPALKAALEETDAKARKRVRETSLSGAREAERAGRWGEAGAKYAKAHAVHAEAWIAERAANAMRLDGGDLRRAAQLAEQAVLAEPHNAAYRVTLGEVYLDAGLVSRATGEAGRAMAIDPEDLRAKALSKKVAKGKA